MTQLKPSLPVFTSVTEFGTAWDEHSTLFLPFPVNGTDNCIFLNQIYYLILLQIFEWCLVMEKQLPSMCYSLNKLVCIVVAIAVSTSGRSKKGKIMNVCLLKNMGG